MVIVSRHIVHILPGCLTQQLALLLALWVLPRVLDNERCPRVIPFTVGFLIGGGLAGNARNAFYNLIKDKSLCMAILFDLDVPLTPSCDDSGVESKLLFVQPQEPKHGGNKLLPVFINVELRGSDPSKLVEVPQPHVGSTQREAGHEAATVLSGKNFSGVSSEVELCFGRHIG
jgi:hypothetical protein